MGQVKQARLDQKDNRSGGKGKNKVKIRFEDYAFIRIELTLDEREGFVGSESDDLTPMQALADLAIPGYKLSITYGDGEHSVIATLTCTDPADVNAGGVLTGRGGDVSKALKVLRFKLVEVIGDRPWRQAEYERGGSYSDIG